MKPEELESIKAYVRKYYPPIVTRIIYGFRNEYNDEGYDVSPGYIVAYDVHENEVVAFKGTEIDAREDIESLPCCFTPEEWDEGCYEMKEAFEIFMAEGN